MSFSFVVNGHAQDNLSGEEEQQRVTALVEELMSGAEDVGINIRIDVFNPPSWAPAQNQNFLVETPKEVGDTGEGSMGVPPTPQGPQGEQTQSSS